MCQEKCPVKINTGELVKQLRSNDMAFLIIGEDAWGQVALKGMSAIKPVVLKASQTNHANPLGQFGYVGASTWFAAVRLNDAWMARIEAGVTAL